MEVCAEGGASYSGRGLAEGAASCRGRGQSAGHHSGDQNQGSGGSPHLHKHQICLETPLCVTSVGGVITCQVR